jgi:hypothetical protein
LLIEDREESFYQAIDRLLYDDELYQRLSRFAVQHIKRNFDSSLVAEKWLSFSLQCIGVSPRKKTLKLPRKIKFPKMDNDQGFIHHPPSYFQTFLSNFKIYLGYLKKEILVRLNFE